MSVINPQMVAALLGVVSDASERRQRRSLARGPSFGRTLSQALASGLGQVPGQAIGSYIGGQVDLSNRRALIGDERAYQDTPVDVPGAPLSAPVPRRFLGEYLSDDLARGRMGEEHRFQMERDAAQADLKDRPVALTPADREEFGIPEPLPLDGPQGILAVPGGALSRTVLEGANTQAGARGTIPLSEYEARARFRGDLGTVAMRRAADEERARHNRETEAIARDRNALAERLAKIRAEARGQDPRLLIARMNNAERNARDIRAQMADLNDPSKFSYSADALRSEQDRLKALLEEAQEELMGLAPLVEGYGAGGGSPPPAPPRAPLPSPDAGASPGNPEDDPEVERLANAGDEQALAEYLRSKGYAR